MTAAQNLATRAAELRAEFDRGFTVALRGEASTKIDLIAIRVGGEPFAIRLAEVAGLFADRKITRVPGGQAALLGIAGFRGALLPVYSLRTLLGVPGATPPRWLVVVAGAALALAFDGFEGHLRAPAETILPQQQAGQEREGVRYAPDFIRAADAVRPVLSLRSIIDALGVPGAAKIPARSNVSWRFSVTGRWAAGWSPASVFRR
jgi:chemotaxis signal transduction protein